MPNVTIEDVIRTRNSAKRRRNTLRKMSRRFGLSYDSPLMACGDTFAENVNRIEAEYDRMLERIENATVNL